ncbi:MAG: ArsA family ATPase [Desulfobacterales bacterium]|nr:ArsA family ATPase [Desulfobacterales bacterium]
MNPITVSMTRFMQEHPKLKYIFFGGKGGVGKTVMAGAAALWAAKQGKRTLLASTNPVHSLSNLLEKDVFGKTAMVCDQENCFAFEIDTKDTIERSKQEIREKINWFLKFADITTQAEEFIESATMNPAFALWVDKMLKSREEAKSLRELLSFSKKKEADPLMDYLLGFKERMARAKELLTDEALTAFFFVTLPESLPIAVITRFINWFHEFGIPVGGVIVNGVIQKEQVADDAAAFVHNRIAMQQEHLQEIWRIFGERVRALLPLFETEIKGAATLHRLESSLFA